MGIRESSYPLSYLDDKQQPIGYHIDVCNRIVDAVKKQLNLPNLKVQHQPVTSQNRIPLVTNGTVDLECGSTTNNEARQKQVAFANTTFVTNVRMAVKKSSGITSLDGLNGKPVATTTGTTSVQLMRAHEKGKHIDFKEVYRQGSRRCLSDAGDRPRRRLRHGRQPAGRPDRHFKGAQGLRHRRRSAERRAHRHHGPQGRSAFKKLADDAIVGLMKSGELEKLYAKWFLLPIPPKNISMDFPMSDKLRELIKNPSDAPAEAYNKK